MMNRKRDAITVDINYPNWDKSGIFLVKFRMDAATLPLLQDVISPLFRANLQQDPPVHQIGQINPKCFRTYVRANGLIVAVGDPAVLTDVGEGACLPFVHALRPWSGGRGL